MQIKSIVAGAAFALAVATSPVSAGEEFRTLEGITAEEMSRTELASVTGEDVGFHLFRSGLFRQLFRVDIAGLHFEVVLTSGPQFFFVVKGHSDCPPNCAGGF